MERDKKLTDKRAKFVQLAVNNKSKAAKDLREIAYSLGYARKEDDIIYALSQIFCVSTKTIERDLRKNLDDKN